MIYKTAYYMMLIGFGTLSFLSNDWKQKIIGILLLLVNALIFYK